MEENKKTVNDQIFPKPTRKFKVDIDPITGKITDSYTEFDEEIKQKEDESNKI